MDAKISTSADISAQAVDVGSVIDAFKAAGNRMNIVVLDACRDNPFASTASGKGLAQLDAPPGTFLAFATAPGNVAEDGDVKTGNGLYTQFLLEELRRPSTKIEDVFKRVRLNVRKQSQGRQIPWKSTSLEDDFVFNAGIQVRVQTRDERAREEAFRVEKADDFYAFLSKYPNGFISLQAGAELERLQAARVAAVPDRNGVVQPMGGPGFRIGDQWRMVVKDEYTGLVQRRVAGRVTGMDGGLVQVNDGRSVFTNGGATVVDPRAGRFDPPRPNYPSDGLAIGKKWTERSILHPPTGASTWVENTTRVIAFEQGTIQRNASESTAYATMERVKGIEPSYAAWEAAVLPLNYTRVS